MLRGLLLTVVLLAPFSCAHEPAAPPDANATRHLPTPTKEQQRRQMLDTMTPLMGQSEPAVVGNKRLKCKLEKSSGRKSRYKCNFFWFPYSSDGDRRHEQIILRFEDDKLVDWKIDD